MGALIELLVGFVEAIGSIIGFVFDMFSDLVYVVALLGKFMIELPGYFSWLPNEIVTLLITAFAIVVIYLILGRK